MSKTTNSLMEKISWILFFSCVITGCKQQNIKETFVVPPDTLPTVKQSSTYLPPLPPPNRAYYFPSNFIIDTEGQVFFYQEEYKPNNDAIVDWNTPPEFIHLTPKDIVQIPVNSIEEFIKLNILNKDSLKRYIAVASEKDTISSVGLSKIMSICKNKQNHIRWKFRMATQEEEIVLDYKKRNENYNPDKIKWDSAKIKIPHLCEVY